MTEHVTPPLDVASDPDDGFQDFLSEDEDNETLLNQESMALEYRMKTLGIRDGLDLGKEHTLQEGFDQGFAFGAARSFRFGKLRGALGTAVACGLFELDVMTQARVCMSLLRTLEMDTSVHKLGEEDISSPEVDTTVRQAREMLTTIGLDLSSKHCSVVSSGSTAGGVTSSRGRDFIRSGAV